MSVLADVRSRVTDLTRLARSEEERYSGGQDRPLGGYLAAMSVYAAAVGTLAGVTRLTGREIPNGLAAGDLLLAAVATHKLSRPGAGCPRSWTGRGHCPPLMPGQAKHCNRGASTWPRPAVTC